MKMNITVIENEITQLNMIEKLLYEWADTGNVDLFLHKYPSGEDFFEKSSSCDCPCNLYLLDIQLDGMNGIEIARKIKSVNPDSNIIFLTSFKEYVFEGYDVHAFNYLIKPVERKQLFHNLDEIRELVSQRSYTFTDQNSTVVIPMNDIMWFTVNRHYIDIHTSKGESYCQIGNLRDIVQKLPSEFIQCHRSHIVNMAYIRSFSRSSILLENETSLPVGRSFYENFRSKFSAYVLRLQ